MDLQKEIQEEIKEDDLDSNLVFSESFSKNIRAKLLSKRLIQKFRQDMFVVDKYDFDDDKSRRELFSYVKEQKSKQLVADRIPTILNEISHTSFSKLLKIYLGLMDHMQGPICSIEALAYLDAENLQLLHINNTTEVDADKSFGKDEVAESGCFVNYRELHQPGGFEQGHVQERGQWDMCYGGDQDAFNNQIAAEKFVPVSLGRAQYDQAGFLNEHYWKEISWNLYRNLMIVMKSQGKLGKVKLIKQLIAFIKAIYLKK